MSNTQTRVLSGIVLILLLMIVISLGTKAVLGTIGLIGLLIIDEIYCNFFKKKRWGAQYFCAQIIYFVPFLLTHFATLKISVKLDQWGVILSLILNCLLIFYLFFMSMNNQVVRKIGEQFPFLVGPFVLLPLLSLAHLTVFKDWMNFLTVLFLVIFGMDTGAWFFGKSFGRHKLWPAVSPKKTFEGLFGGMLTAGLLGSSYWYFLTEEKFLLSFVLFMFLGLISQFGDLIQSKIKRQCELKDSSSLIPGHGGVYDRVDSLIFASPFYVSALKIFFS